MFMMFDREKKTGHKLPIQNFSTITFPQLLINMILLTHNHIPCWFFFLFMKQWSFTTIISFSYFYSFQFPVEKHN